MQIKVFLKDLISTFCHFVDKTLRKLDWLGKTPKQKEPKITEIQLLSHVFQDVILICCKMLLTENRPKYYKLYCKYLN